MGGGGVGVTEGVKLLRLRTALYAMKLSAQNSTANHIIRIK